MERPPVRRLSPSTPLPQNRRRVVPGLLAICCALVLGALAPPARAAAEAGTRCDQAPHHRLDFWVGDWQVLGAGGEKVGTSRIERLHGGCLVRETWSAAGGAVTGEGLSYIDPTDGLWKQLWVDSTGTVTRTKQSPGAVGGGALRFDGESVRPDGAAVLSRMTVDPVGDERVHVAIEHSADGGATWETVFDVTYTPVTPGAAETTAPEAQPRPEPTPRPAPVPAPAPAPEPPPAPPSGGVRASSGVVPDQEVPLDKRNKIFLESPMVLEVPIGPIESIPEEYSWSSKETSVYVSDGVSVRRVTLSRDERGKTVAVAAVVVLHSPDVLHHVDLMAELVWQGETLASASEDKISVGRSILAQNRDDGIEKTLRLSLDRGRFDEVFGDPDERPVLRLTVTARN